jgi:SagB-type dehydrogenase family enzyme
MERTTRRVLLALLSIAGLGVLLDRAFGPGVAPRLDGGTAGDGAGPVSLPPPRADGDVSVERAIADRRSRREFRDLPLSLADLGQLLWAVQGVTEERTGYRAAPSAGALYPLEVHAVVGSPGVEDLAPGVYRYRPESHDLVVVERGDVQSDLRAAALDQAAVEAAVVDVVVSAVDSRTTRKYGDRGRRRYVPMEAGHAGQNLYLQAESLGLSTVAVGAFRDDRVRDVLNAAADRRPLYVFPVGVHER